MNAVSVLVADDHEMVRQGLCSLIELRDDWKTVEANNGLEALVKAKQLQPDIVVMDINMPHLNGLDATRELRKEFPQMPVIILSGYSTQELVERALAAGVRGYVLKTDAAKDLLSAVQAVLEGNTFFTGPLFHHLRQYTTTRSIKHHGPRELTVREAEVVQLLCAGKANKQIAAALGISTRTVENYRAHIMQKLRLNSFSELVRYAIRNGIVQP